MLLHHVDHEQGRGQTGQVGDRTEVLLQLGTLTAHLQDLTLREVSISTVAHEFVDGSHLLHSLADGGEVGEHTARPTLDNVRHIHSSSLLGHDVLSLLLRSNEEDLLTRLSNLLQGLSSLVDLCNSLVQVDDMNTVTLHEDVGSHSGVPLALEVTEVTSGLEQHVKICSCHFFLMFNCLLSF